MTVVVLPPLPAVVARPQNGDTILMGVAKGYTVPHLPKQTSERAADGKQLPTTATVSRPSMLAMGWFPPVDRNTIWLSACEPSHLPCLLGCLLGHSHHVAPTAASAV